ncbi:MAG: enoyl-ACP reductase [Alphaproteobacteria bacterium]|nr:enoyl-ACP reductase [Alphaproteobacteria bacterium]
MSRGLLEGKRGLIMGVANSMSIAWSIAELAHKEGADLAFTFPNEAMKKRVTTLAEQLGIDKTFHCDVSNQKSITSLFENIASNFGRLDFILHSIAFSDKAELKGRFIDTSLDNFTNSMNISCFSLVNIAKEAEFLLNENASLLTLSYLGSQKVIPSYNVMGVAKAALEASVRYLAYDLGSKNIRVNSISAGPIKTLASSAIGDFKSMLDLHKSTSPLQRNTTLEDVAKSGVYFLSDLSSGVTGETHYVDCGYNVMGMSIIR